jgi:precorrin-6Y C5,15-methyltransferase (decarboxylating)
MEERETTGAPWLSIVGIGEDGAEGLSPEARQLVNAAELVVGGARHLALAGGLVRGEALKWPSPLHDAFPEIMKRRGRPVVVLATGDPFFYGVGKQLAALVARGEMRCLPQPSAFSLAAARLGWALEDTAEVTLHGRALDGIVPHLKPGARILALSWDGTTPGKVAELLTERGLGASEVTVLEAMGGPRERVRGATASAFDLDGIDPLNTLAVEVVASGDSETIPLACGLDDALFESDGQLSKREMRSITVSSLAPRSGELLWDVGLGSGSIAIEWLMCGPSLRAVGIEERPERAERARRNAARLGAARLGIVIGHAPEVLAGLPEPDAVFVGGGLSDPGVFEAAWRALKSGGRLVANAVTLETEARLSGLYAAHGGELTRVEIARAEPVGSLHGWRPALPVTHWRVRKP